MLLRKIRYHRAHRGTQGNGNFVLRFCGLATLSSRRARRCLRGGRGNWGRDVGIFRPSRSRRTSEKAIVSLVQEPPGVLSVSVQVRSRSSAQNRQRSPLPAQPDASPARRHQSRFLWPMRLPWCVINCCRTWRRPHLTSWISGPTVLYRSRTP